MSDLPTVAIELTASATADVRALIAELDEVLSSDYPPEHAAVALFDDFAEVKRVYVRGRARGHGVARALLARLEMEAGDAGLGALRCDAARKHRHQRLSSKNHWARNLRRRHTLPVDPFRDESFGEQHVCSHALATR
jgi:GNAT superfamily N-acetyltransferase